jgi:hypothetical protein
MPTHVVCYSVWMSRWRTDCALEFIATCLAACDASSPSMNVTSGGNGYPTSGSRLPLACATVHLLPNRVGMLMVVIMVMIMSFLLTVA